MRRKPDAARGMLIILGVGAAVFLVALQVWVWFSG